MKKTNEFVTWVNNGLNERGWSNSELARRSGLAHSTISMVISGHKNAGWDFCAAIAKAFGESPDKVFRLAGLLPPEPDPAQGEDDLLAVFRQLGKQQQKYVLDSLRGLLGQPRAASKSPAITIITEPPEIIIPDRDEGTVPDPEEMITLLKMLDETERYFVYDYIIWRLIEMQRKRNSSGRKRTEQERKQEHGEAIDVINLMLAIDEADPARIEQVIDWLQKQKSRKEEHQAAGPELLAGK